MDDEPITTTKVCYYLCCEYVPVPEGLPFCYTFRPTVDEILAEPAVCQVGNAFIVNNVSLHDCFILGLQSLNLQ